MIWIIWKKPLLKHAALVSACTFSKQDRLGKVSVRLNMNLMKNLIMDDVSAWRRLFTTNPWLLALRWSPIQVLSQHDESYQWKTNYLLEKLTAGKYIAMLGRHLTQRGNWSVQQLEKKQDWIWCEHPLSNTFFWAKFCLKDESKYKLQYTWIC